MITKMIAEAKIMKIYHMSNIVPGALHALFDLIIRTILWNCTVINLIL